MLKGWEVKRILGSMQCLWGKVRFELCFRGSVGFWRWIGWGERVVGDFPERSNRLGKSMGSRRVLGVLREKCRHLSGWNVDV